MIGPALAHPTCDLALQRRIREARLGAISRRARRARREGAQAPPADVADAAFSGGEDVWRSLRF